MKRTVALTILGIAAATTAYGQGSIALGNYFAPYVPTVYSGGPLDGVAVAPGDGVSIEVWWGQGAGLDQNSLALGETFAALNGNYDGYYGPEIFVIPTWSAGQTWTFQFRASGDVLGTPIDTGASRGGTFSTDQIVLDGGPTPPTYFKTPESSFTVVVPEPTTFALAGLGAAALLIFRRRD